MKLTKAQRRALEKYAARPDGGYYKDLKIQWKVMQGLHSLGLIGWQSMREWITEKGREALDNANQR
jgi:ribosomal protein S19E (S16A)